ncbi:MAG: replication-associated recombination protein A [bacterium]|nr:replication-associated recombination protein A [bacterium]
MNKPLALKLKPVSIKDIIGQKHLIGDNKIISNMVENKKIFSMILYGPPGIGKTSIANAIVNDIECNYRFLNAVLNTKKDFDVVIEEAKMYDGMVLIIDEIHRMNKDKQDILLPCLESGLITLIGMTTSNPYHKINPAIRSRCQIFKLNALDSNDICDGIKRAINSDDLKGIKIDDETIKYISEISGGDLRFAFNLLEVSYYFNKEHEVSIEVIKSINSKPNFFHDKNETGHYDVLSGLQKSIRGSDADASIHYLARLLKVGDLDSIYRRLSVICYEDIGLANPSIGPKLNAAIDACERVGLPECELILAPIVIEMALSPKSNSAYLAIHKALLDLDTKNIGEIPNHIKSPYIGYKYPHNYKNSYVIQRYLPDNIKNEKYYIPKNTSNYEKVLGEVKKKIDKLKEEA